jgi:3-hydroxyacyl-CoA dehydrogenase
MPSSQPVLPPDWASSGLIFDIFQIFSPTMNQRSTNFHRIRKAAVLGSGIMGSRIACHFANAGLDVLLMDIPSPDSEGKPAKERNRLTNAALELAIKSKPSPLFSASLLKSIQTGNLEDDLARLSGCDWILEAVTEDIRIKKQLYQKLESHRKPGSIISSNTSGIPLHILSEGMSEDFRKHFCGTHFFNPPRYLPLLEIIPGPDTEPEILTFLQDFGGRILGKTTILCKDTPAFIANRIGVFSMLDTVRIALKLGLSVEETDQLTGTLIGRPKSATFRTADVVGIDTLVRVAEGLNQALGRPELQIPEIIRQMQNLKWLGDKTAQGFYKKIITENGKKEFLQLSLIRCEYETGSQNSGLIPAEVKNMDAADSRLAYLISGNGKATMFLREMLGSLFSYAANCLPEISDEASLVDAAVEAGFGWESGPFACWQSIGFLKGIELIQEAGHQIPEWILRLSQEKEPVFFRKSNMEKQEWSPVSCSFIPSAKLHDGISLKELRNQKPVFRNPGSTLHNLGEGIACLEFHSKMNTLGSEVVEGMNRAFDLAEQNFRGLVIGNQGANFSAGANLGLVFMHAIEQEFDEIDLMVRQFQHTVMRVRYSGIPVVIAPHGLSLGGACELTLHADGVQAAAETYMGLVETGVGLIPAGGGTKEMARRISRGLQSGDPVLNRMQNTFMNMAMAKVSESAHQAMELGYLNTSDRISMNRRFQISNAAELAGLMADGGYVQPMPDKNILVTGRAGMANLFAGIQAMECSGRISAHERKVAEKLCFVLNGGDLSYPQTVSEEYLLELEREAFLSLCGEKKTLERMQSLLNGGKIIRN